MTATRPVSIGMPAPSRAAALVARDLVRRAPTVLAPCHCTGRLAAAALRRALPDAVLPLGSGAVVG